MTGRTNFSIHEAVILLDDYMKGVDNGESRVQTAKRVSDDLRTMAINLGMVVPGSYRTVKGISDRLISMECAVEGTRRSSVYVSDLFVRVADMYKSDKKQYEHLLSEARAMIDKKISGAERFVEWVRKNAPGKDTTWIECNLLRVENLGSMLNLIDGSIFDVVDADILSKLRKGMQKHRLFKLACGKFYNNIVEDFELYCRYRANTAAHDAALADKEKMKYTNSGRGNMPPAPRKHDDLQYILRDAIMKNYPGGVRFDDTVLRLLSEETGVKITRTQAALLQNQMYKRSDGLLFLPDMLASDGAIKNIKSRILMLLSRYSLCEVAVLYRDFQADNSTAALRNVEDYADFLEYMLPGTVRTANAYGAKIVKSAGVSISEATGKLARLLVEAVKEGGCVTEDDLLQMYPVISGAFLKKMLEKNTDEVFATTINDIICYQTIEAMGFDDSFSEMLNAVIERTSELNLAPTLETIHVLLSVETGQNFREAYGIPDDKTFRRIVSMYYSGESARTWKAGSFMEEQSDDV